jgi:diaminopimelate epimerase
MAGDPIPFAKAHACGNDFLIVEARAMAGCEGAPLARAMCARHTGIGADGMERLTLSSRSEAALRLYNADGTIAEVSGNGTRCVAAWMASRAGMRAGDELRLHTDAGLRICRLESVQGCRFEFTTSMGVPRVSPRRLRLGDGTEIRGATVDMGNPQFIAWAEDDRFAVAGRAWEAVGAEICAHPEFPAGTNVEFLRRRGPDRFEIRIYERGVGPTSSSGTGTSASAAMLMALEGAPRVVHVLAPGGGQVVSWPADSAELTLTGPAVVLAACEWMAGSEA